MASTVSASSRPDSPSHAVITAVSTFAFVEVEALRVLSAFARVAALRIQDKHHTKSFAATYQKIKADGTKARALPKLEAPVNDRAARIASASFWPTTEVLGRVWQNKEKEKAIESILFVKMAAAPVKLIAKGFGIQSTTPSDAKDQAEAARFEKVYDLPAEAYLDAKRDLPAAAMAVAGAVGLAAGGAELIGASLTPIARNFKASNLKHARLVRETQKMDPRHRAYLEKMGALDSHSGAVPQVQRLPDRNPFK